jgi:hypothetical protein
MLTTGKETLNFHVMIEVFLKFPEVNRWLLTFNSPFYLFIFIVYSFKLSLTG